MSRLITREWSTTSVPTKEFYFRFVCAKRTLVGVYLIRKFRKKKTALFDNSLVMNEDIEDDDVNNKFYYCPFIVKQQT